uniref:Uncharacterized protein n=1 Tax=Pseudonaja textilis TaxID=8673 RepID=A0A670Y619_PSETE
KKKNHLILKPGLPQSSGFSHLQPTSIFCRWIRGACLENPHSLSSCPPCLCLEVKQRQA